MEFLLWLAIVITHPSHK